MKSFTRGLRSVLASPSMRRYWIIGSFILIFLGDRLIRLKEPFTNYPPLLEAASDWNIKLYLGLYTLLNILVGCILMLAGAVLFGRLMKSPAWTQTEYASLLNSWQKINWARIFPWLAGNLVIFSLVMAELSHHNDSGAILWGWAYTLTLPTILLWHYERKAEISLNLPVTRLDGVWMLLLFGLAIGMGSYLLNDLPLGWFPDEYAFWEKARLLAIGEQEQSIFDYGVYTFPVASSMFQEWVFSWTGINFWGWRFGSVLPAALTVFPLYVLASTLFDRRVAVAANIMMIVNPYFLLFARFGYNNSQSLFPVTLCICLLVLGLQKNSRFYFWLSGLTAGLGFYTYFAAWLGLVVIILVVLVLAYFHRETFWNRLKPLGLIVLGSLAIMLPRILYGLNGEYPELLNNKVWETSLISAYYGWAIFGEERLSQAVVFMVNQRMEVFYDPVLYVIVLLRGLILSTVVLFDTAGYYEHYLTFGLAGPGSSIFLVLGLGLAIANIKKQQYFIPSTWFVTGFVFLGVFASTPPRPTHMIAIIPVMALLSAIGLVSFLDAITQAISDPGRMLRLKRIALTGTLFIVAGMGLFQYFFMTSYIYPANPEDYISWLGRQRAAPANLFLIDFKAAARHPLEESILKITQYQVTQLTRAGLEKDPDQIKSWKDFAAFFNTSNDREFAEWLAGQIPGADVKPVYVPFAQFRGYMVTDAQINTTIDLSLARGLRDLWTSPARNILLFCGAGILVLLAIENKTQITAMLTFARAKRT